MLTVAESSQSHQRQISPTTPNPIPLSMVAPGCNEGSPNTSHKRALTDQSTCKSRAIKHVEELKGNLDNAFPRFVKSMLPSHIIGKCRLRLPSDFCNNHLPKQNMTIYLIDENQKEYPVQYLLRKKGLSGGWKGFTIAHKLVEGDVLVFQLVKPTKFQEAANCTEGCRSSKRALTDPDKTKSRAIQQAQKVQANLDRAFPSFVKSVHLSHVSGVYILGIPKLFCKDFLPEKNAIITLINENQEEYQVEYNRRKFKVHTGWKEFSIAHKLVEGDGLVFQLVKPTILKVYIARLNSSQTKDEVISVQNVDAPQEKNKSGTRTKTRDKTVKKHQKTVQLAALMQPEVKPDCSYEEAGSDVLGSMKSSTVDIKTIKSMENFSIVVNGVTMDSEFSEQARQKYYELCCSQNSVLHEKLLDTINFQMAVGIISQTIEVADKIRSCTRATSLDEFTKWNINLGAFEQLGMNVGFLRDRIKQLVSLVCKVEEGVDSKDCGEVIDGRDDVMQEMERLKAKLDDIIQEIQRLKAKRDELRVNSEMFDSEINTLEVKAKYYELKFQGEVDAPW